MAAPVLSHTAQRLYDALRPLARRDADHGYALAHLCAAVARSVDPIADLSRDVDADTPGWSQLYDVDNVPGEWLPWLAQHVGVELPEGLDDAGRRTRIRETSNFKRGSVGAMRGAARQYLSGDKTVYLLERHGSPWKTTVSTLQDETPFTDWDPRPQVVRETPGLVSRWLRRGSLTQDDVSGYDATLVTGAHPTLVDGLVGGGHAAYFGDAGTPRRLVVPYRPELNTRAFTIEMWVRLDSALTANHGLWSNRTTNVNGCLLFVGVIDSKPRLQLHYNGGSTTLISSETLQLGETHHLVAHYNGSRGRLFLDGEIVANQLTDYRPPTSENSLIGFYPNASAFPGTIDEVAYYNRALSADEVAEHASDTPTTSLVYDALVERKPAGIIVTHEVIRGGDFNTLRDTHVDFDDVAASFTDFNELRANPAQQP